MKVTSTKEYDCLQIPEEDFGPSCMDEIGKFIKVEACEFFPTSATIYYLLKGNSFSASSRQEYLRIYPGCTMVKDPASGKVEALDKDSFSQKFKPLNT